MKDELVSIIIPCFNAERYIINTLESVKNQTYTNYEVIIVNDSSTDNSKEIIEEYIKNDSRFHLLNLESNYGVSFARNTGIENSKGKYIAFLDSDDIWLPMKLSRQINFMKINNCSFSCTAYEILDNRNNKIIKKVIPDRKLDFNLLLHGNQIACFTVVIEKKIVENIYFEKIRHEDYKFWLDILKNKGTKCYSMNEILGIYRKSDDSLSGNKLKAAIWTFNILWKEIPYKLNVFKCFFLYVLKSLKKHY